MRRFSVLAAALAAALALPLTASAQPGAAPAPRERPAASLRAAVAAGPMLGYSMHREVAVWVQTTAPARVQIAYAALPDSGRAATPTVTTPEIATTAAGDHIAHIVVAGLEPGRRYRYSVRLNGRPVPGAHEFRTEPLWQWRTDPPTFTVAIGSCAYVNEPAVDRPGRPYGGQYGIFEAIAAMRPHAMVWMGDNTYLREVDWWTPTGIARRHAHTRALPEMQRLLGSTHHYATWDDHDYGPNDADRSFVLKDVALDAFRRYWANPSYGLPETPGVFGQFELGDAAFFLLDDRYHRAPNGDPDSSKAYLGDAQLTWLLDAMTASRATFKFVVNGGQVLNEARVFENMATYPVERRRLLDGLAARRITGVLFLSGDRHFTELLALPRPGLPTLYDFTASSLTAGAGGPVAAERDNPLRVAGTLVERQNNFGTLTFSGPRTDRRLTMRSYSVDGGLLWEHSVSATDLGAVVR